MIRFRKIKAENLFSFERLELDYRPGVILVKGINHDSELADSNFSGKTNAVVESLLWTLYGIPSKSQSPYGSSMSFFRQESVIRAGEDSCTSSVEFEKSGNVYQIIRSRGRSSGGSLKLYENGRDITCTSQSDTQKLINSIIPSCRLFSQSCVYAQSGRRFSVLRDSERKEILDDLFDFHILNRAREESSRLLQSSLSESKTIDTTIDYLSENVNSAVGRVVGIYDSAVENEIYEYLDNLSRVRERISEYHDSISSELIYRIGSLMRNIEKAEDAVSSFISLPDKKYVDILESVISSDHLSTVINTLDQVLEIVFSRIRHHQLMVNLASTGESFVCEVCGSVVDPGRNDIGSCASDIEYLSEIAEHIADVIGELVDVERLIYDIRQNYHDTVADTQDVLASLNIEDTLSVIRNLYNSYQVVEDQYDLDNSFNTGSLISFAGLCCDLEKTARKLIQKMSEKRKISQKIDSYKKLVEAFGNRGVKSLILDAVVPRMNAILDEYVNMLFGGRIKASFYSWFESSSGKVRDELIFDVVSEDGQGYFMCSGGQRARIDICVALMFYTLLGESGRGSNIFLADEPWENVDRPGIESIMNLMRKISRERECCIYVISHVEGIESLFDSVITVERKNGVSFIS